MIEKVDIGILRSEGWRLKKNVVVMSIAFMLVFTAYHGTSNLQSSINAEGGLGTASLSAVYLCLILSNIFLPAATIKWLGSKCTICVSFLMFLPYIVVQLWPSFYSLIPTGIIIGLGEGPLWCAKCTYLSLVAETYGRISNQSPKMLLVKFLGIFFMVVQSNQIWGNLISSLVLNSGDNEAAVTSLNASLIPVLCGANFQREQSTEALRPQPLEKIQMLVGIYAACILVAVLIVVFFVGSMDKLDSDRSKTESNLSGWPLLTVTAKLFMEPNLQFLFVMNIFMGWAQSTFETEFTSAFISCAMGTGSIGFVAMAHGVGDVIGCILTWSLIKITGRLTLMASAAAIQMSIFITLLTWRPETHTTFALYIISGFWGVCNSITFVQINGFFGILFPGREEAAFSNFRLWNSMGFIFVYLISPYIRTNVKLIIIIVVMIVGFSGYLSVEYRRSIAKRKIKVTQVSCNNKAFENVE